MNKKIVILLCIAMHHSCFYGSQSISSAVYSSSSAQKIKQPFFEIGPPFACVKLYPEHLVESKQLENGQTYQLFYHQSSEPYYIYENQSKVFAGETSTISLFEVYSKDEKLVKYTMFQRWRIPWNLSPESKLKPCVPCLTYLSVIDAHPAVSNCGIHGYGQHEDDKELFKTKLAYINTLRNKTGK